MEPSYFEHLHAHMEWNDRIREDNRNKQRRYRADKRKLIRTYFRRQIVLFNYLVNDYNWLDVHFFVRQQKAGFYYWGIPNELDPISFLAERSLGKAS